MDCAYIDGAYIDAPESGFKVVTERLDECPKNGTLGRRGRPLRSFPNEELLRELASKWPDRFSRRVACRENEESLRGGGGSGGSFVDVGEAARGDGGVVVLAVELVVGRSEPLDGATSCRAFKKTFKMGDDGVAFDS